MAGIAARLGLVMGSAVLLSNGRGVGAELRKNTGGCTIWPYNWYQGCPTGWWNCGNEKSGASPFLRAQGAPHAQAPHAHACAY